MFERIYRSKKETIRDYIGSDCDDETVTVAVSCYNYERFLIECLDSVAAQTFDNLDIVIVDDCSSADKSVETALGWLIAHKQRFRRSTLLRHQRNQGLAQARNTAFDFCRSKRVFVLDADNCIYPRAIEVLARHVHPAGSSAAYCQIEMFGETRALGFADYWDPVFFQNGNYVDAMSLIAKSVWNSVGGYVHLEGGWEDYDFWCSMIEAGFEAVFVPQVLCRYRVHGTSMLRTETRERDSELRVEMMLRHPWLKLPVVEA